MPLAFSSGAYGTTSIPVTYSTERRFNSTKSLLFISTVPLIMFTHVRGGGTSNRFRRLPSSTTKWRDPSNYNRGQFNWLTYATGDYKDSSSIGFYKTILLPNHVMLAYNASTKRIPWISAIGGAQKPQDHADLTNTRNTSITKALNDLGQSKANVGEALATARQTADLFVDAAWTLLKFVRDARNGRLIWELRNLNVKKILNAAKSGAIPKTVANRWLQFHYGWKPLAQDVHGLWELLNEQLGTPALLVHGRGRGEWFWEESTEIPSTTVNPCMKLDMSATFQSQVSVTGQVDSLQIFRTVNQAGLVNPAALAWELIPFSFVVDWVVPIGNVLTALSATAGLNFVGGHRTERYEHSVTGTVSGSSILGDPTRPPSTEFRAFGFDRYKYAGFPLPVPYVKPFSTKRARIATIASLLTNLIQFR